MSLSPTRKPLSASRASWLPTGAGKLGVGLGIPKGLVLGCCGSHRGDLSSHHDEVNLASTLGRSCGGRRLERPPELGQMGERESIGLKPSEDRGRDANGAVVRNESSSPRTDLDDASRREYSKRCVNGGSAHSEDQGELAF